MKFKYLFLIIFLFTNINALDKAVGLNNLSNTCFMNATLQCLFSLDEFNDLALQNINNYYENSISQKYLHLLNYYKDSQDESFKPRSFCELIRGEFKLNEKGSQEDAHELLTKLLSHLTNENIKQGNAQLKAKFKNLIYIYLKTKMFKDKNVRIGSIIDETALPLEITGNNLTYCLDSFFAKETLERPTEESETEKQYKISSLPKYLIIQLKRFRVNLTKINTSVQFEKKLNLSKYLAAEIESQNANYNLVGIIVQSGRTLNKGHYYAYAKRNNQWYKFNDNLVEEIEELPLQNISDFDTPYILFYEKKELIQEFVNFIKKVQEQEGIENQLNTLIGLPVDIPQALRNFEPWSFWNYMGFQTTNPWKNINIENLSEQITKDNVDNLLNVAQQFITNLQK